MKRVLIVIVAGLLLSPLYAMSDDEAEYDIVLPAAAQECILPAAPDAISPDADYDQLVAAKGQVANFQDMLQPYRECLKSAEEDEDLTPGNKQALVASYNYSVDMEERVAQRFNDAIRSYKERTATE